MKRLILTTLIMLPPLSQAELDSSYAATVIAASADTAAADEELSASFDYAAVWGKDNFSGFIHIEASSSQEHDSVSSVFPESNADAGTAVGRQGEGRIQLSSLGVQLDTNLTSWSIGLIDATSFLDTSLYANDENTQFNASSFVNNPSIEFPDYSLGAAYNKKNNAEDTVFSMVLLASNGLADNVKASYRELVDLSSSQKGVFFALEKKWPIKNGGLSLGGWVNTAEHDYLNGSKTEGENKGVYMLVDHRYNNQFFNIRLGAADENVSRAEKFIAASYQYSVSEYAQLGAGLSRTFLSPKDPQVNTGDITQFATYYRYKVSPNIQLTPSIQRIENSGFFAGKAFRENKVWIFSIRLHADF